MRTQISKVTTQSWISIDEIKQHCRVDHSEDDGLLNIYCLAAVNLIEKECQINLLSTVFEQAYQASDSSYLIDCYPVTAVNSVKYYDLTNTLQTIDANNYMAYLPQSSRGIVTLKQGVDLASVYNRPDAVIINYTSATTPDNLLKSAILLQVGSFFEQRQNETELNLKTISIGVQRICDLYKETH